MNAGQKAYIFQALRQRRCVVAEDLIAAALSRLSAGCPQHPAYLLLLLRNYDCLPETDAQRRYHEQADKNKDEKAAHHLGFLANFDRRLE